MNWLMTSTERMATQGTLFQAVLDKGVDGKQAARLSGGTGGHCQSKTQMGAPPCPGGARVVRERDEEQSYQPTRAYGAMRRCRPESAEVRSAACRTEKARIDAQAPPNAAGGPARPGLAPLATSVAHGGCGESPKRLAEIAEIRTAEV